MGRFESKFMKNGVIGNFVMNLPKW